MMNIQVDREERKSEEASVTDIVNTKLYNTEQGDESNHEEQDPHDEKEEEEGDIPRLEPPIPIDWEQDIEKYLKDEGPEEEF